MYLASRGACPFEVKIVFSLALVLAVTQVALTGKPAPCQGWLERRPTAIIDRALPVVDAFDWTVILMHRYATPILFVEEPDRGERRTFEAFDENLRAALERLGRLFQDYRWECVGEGEGRIVIYGESQTYLSWILGGSPVRESMASAMARMLAGVAAHKRGDTARPIVVFPPAFRGTRTPFFSESIILPAGTFLQQLVTIAGPPTQVAQITIGPMGRYLGLGPLASSRDGKLRRLRAERKRDEAKPIGPFAKAISKSQVPSAESTDERACCRWTRETPSGLSDVGAKR